MMNEDDRDVDPDLLPGELSFYLGNYSGRSCMIRWDGISLRAEKTEGGNFSGISRIYKPDAGQWRVFWAMVDDLGVWSWERSYVASHGCCGVTYWQLALSHGGHTISSSGEDLFPDSEGAGVSAVFRAFIEAIQALCNE